MKKILTKPKELLEFLYIKTVSSVKKRESKTVLNLPTAYQLLQIFIRKEKLNGE